MKKHKQSSVVKWATILGIALTTNLFVAYTIQAFTPAPTWEEYCGKVEVISKPIIDDRRPTAPVVVTEDPYKACNDEYNLARADYERNVFMILVALGIAGIMLSSTLASSAVASGAALAGLGSLLVASTRYWDMMNDKGRVLVLAAGVIALLWYASKKLKDE
jgi:hypothetical protein